MNGRTYEATVVNGQVRLLTETQLPENARVLVLVSDEDAPAAKLFSPRLAHPAQLKDFELEVIEAPHAGL